MKTSVLICFILFSCFFFELHHIIDANQADRLQELINESRQSPKLLQDSWTNMNDGMVYTPFYIDPQEELIDKIVELPGQPQGVDFDQYAGYVKVDEKAGRALFYYFVESPQEPSTKPLVLWLNGGPGCSSLYGATVELGPFRVNGDGKTLYSNQYAWNTVANVLFLDSPAGVGFSYTNTTSDYQSTGDERTAVDAYIFIINWLERFPQYKTSDFYITGESYAGHYVPELASTILYNNKITNQTYINLKGIAIGNPFFDLITYTKGVYENYWSHFLIGEETHQAISSTCNFTDLNYSTECLTSLKEANAEIGNIDKYDIYASLCLDSSSQSTTVGSELNEADPCSENYATSYLNLPEVQKALHANVTNLQYLWSVCSGLVGADNWHDAPASTLPIVKELIDSGVRVWLFSGDTDSVVPVTTTRYSLDILALPVQTSWRAWYIDSEVGGYVVGYKGLTFATVRGAGHHVPFDQPERVLVLFTSFLGGTLPPAA